MKVSREFFTHSGNVIPFPSRDMKAPFETTGIQIPRDFTGPVPGPVWAIQNPSLPLKSVPFSESKMSSVKSTEGRA